MPRLALAHTGLETHVVVVDPGGAAFNGATFSWTATTYFMGQPFWFRIYNENASFGGGGGSTNLSGIPHQMAFFNTPTQLVGTPLAEVSGNQVLFADGISGEPIIAFLNHQTYGIFFEPSGIIATSGPGLAIVANGVERLHCGTSNVVVPNTNLICSGGAIRTTLAVGLGDIWAFGGGQIISGNPGVTTGGGLVRASAAGPTPHDWEDGHLGNSEFIYFTAADFVQGGNMTVSSTGVFSASTKLNPVGSVRQNVGATSSALPTIWGGGGAGIPANVTCDQAVTLTLPLNQFANTTPATAPANFDYTIKSLTSLGTPQITGTTTQDKSVLMAQKIIPKGFKIVGSGGGGVPVDQITIFTKSLIVLPFTSLTVYSQTIQTGGGTTQILNVAPYTPNSAQTIITDTVGDGKTAVIIEIDLGMALTTTDGLIGARISMQRM